MDQHDLGPSDEQLLDTLLRDAEWPDEDPHSLARLQQSWHEVAPARRRQKLFRRAMALAAALACVVAGGLLWRAANPHQEPQLAAPLPSTVPEPLPVERFAEQDLSPNTTDSQKPDLPGNRLVEPPNEVPELATVREPNHYESLLFRAGQRRSALAGQQQDDQLVADALRQLRENPTTDPRTIAEPLLLQRTNAELRLATILRQSGGEEQLAAIRLLGVVGTHRSIPILLELCQHAPVHDAAVRSLATLADPPLLGRLAAAERNPLLRRQLLATLLARGDVPSVALFLSFVEADAEAPLALAATADVSLLPIEVLLEFLHGPLLSQRMAAARVLGRIDDSRIPERLISMVLENSYRQEALVALLSSPRREASEFLAFARHDPLLLASVQAAHFRFTNLP